MLQSEIDEISVAFSEAWDEYFGQPMYYVPYKTIEDNIHPLYRETRQKEYDWKNKVLFNGTFKQEKYEERGEINGRDNYEEAEITLVTKELYDEGIKVIDQSAIIEIIHRDGSRKLYNIVANYGKVQLGDNKVFTKIEVVEITNFSEISLDEDDYEKEEE